MLTLTPLRRSSASAGAKKTHQLSLAAFKNLPVETKQAGSIATGDGGEWSPPPISVRYPHPKDGWGG